jgi:hypothetical protein
MEKIINRPNMLSRIMTPKSVPGNSIQTISGIINRPISNPGTI